MTNAFLQKRKAQNRAAQRAFRERKEKHLKDMETKVNDLEKASESANHENSLLRAQVDRLQTELKEYRKRLHLNGSSLASSPPLGGSAPWMKKYSGSNNSGNAFQFDFPNFGGLPGSHIFNNGAESKKSVSGQQFVPGVLNRSNPTPRSSSSPQMQNGNSPAKRDSTISQLSPGSQPQNSIDGLEDLFSPSIIKSLSKNNSFDWSPKASGSSEDSTGLHNTPNLNGGSSLDFSASPSASSVSQHGPGSSCGTSPEPSHNSPMNKNGESALNTINEEGHTCQKSSDGEISFCEKLNMACGNPNNPVPRAMSLSNDTSNLPVIASPDTGTNGIDWMSQQNGGAFEPDLFGSYREPQEAVTTAQFDSYFNEAFPLPDLGTPFSSGDLHTQKKNLLDIIDNDEDDDEVVPGDNMNKLLSCNKIWLVTQSSPKSYAYKSCPSYLGSGLRTSPLHLWNSSASKKQKVDAWGNTAVIHRIKRTKMPRRHSTAKLVPVEA
jgi:AP-1-like transcription factor